MIEDVCIQIQILCFDTTDSKKIVCHTSTKSDAINQFSEFMIFFFKLLNLL